MKGYEHDLGREKTNLDVFYTILNFFLAQNRYFSKNPKNNISFDILTLPFLGRSLFTHKNGTENGQKRNFAKFHPKPKHHVLSI